MFLLDFSVMLRGKEITLGPELPAGGRQRQQPVKGRALNAPGHFLSRGRLPGDPYRSLELFTPRQCTKQASLGLLQGKKDIPYPGIGRAESYISKRRSPITFVMILSRKQPRGDDHFLGTADAVTKLP